MTPFAIFAVIIFLFWIGHDIYRTPVTPDDKDPTDIY